MKLAAFGLIFLGAIGFGASIFLVTGGARPASATSPTPAPSPTSTAPPTHTETADQAVAASAAADISGEWRGDDGYRFRFTQQDAHIRYDAMHGSKPAGTGEGTLQGRTLRYRFNDVESNDQGSCEASLSEDSRVIEGSCRSDGGGEAWPMRIER